MKTILKGTTSNKNELIRTFYPLVGSITDYQKNITDILSKIQNDGPTRNDLIQWMMEQYKSSREFCRKLLDILRAVGLIVNAEKHYQLTDVALQYLKTNHSEVLAGVFVNKVLGFAELIEILNHKNTMDNNTLRTEWESSLSVTLPKSQFNHRLTWLRGLGFSDLVARNYFLTESGLKLATEIKQKDAVTIEDKQKLSHKDLEDSIKVIGEFFEFETTARPSINQVLPSYALKLTEGDRQLDCLWVRYIPFAGKIKFPIEIQLGGNLADTLDRLETVSEYVQKAIIITDEDQEKKIVDRLKVKKSRLLDKLLIVSVEDVYKAVQATNVLKSFTTKIFSD